MVTLKKKVSKFFNAFHLVKIFFVELSSVLYYFSFHYKVLNKIMKIR